MAIFPSPIVTNRIRDLQPEIDSDILSLEELSCAVYGDGIAISDVERFRSTFRIAGFTTNPTLIASARAPNYLEFAAQFLNAVPDLPVSFEVVADDHENMRRQALVLRSLGDNVFVKVPVVNTQGIGSYNLIRQLTSDGIPLNITAVFTEKQIDNTLAALSGENAPAVVSVFAGRIADTGRDPERIVRHAVNACADMDHIQVLWASVREVYNLVQASRTGCDIVTVPPSLLKKTASLGKDLSVFSRETVQMFDRDAREAGYTF